MNGQMMDLPLLVASVIDHAAAWHATTEVVSRDPSGAICRATWGEVSDRSKRLAQGLERLGVVPGTVCGSLAWNTQQHLELFYGVSGSGAVLHTINPRLFEDQIAYIAGHARDEWLFCDAATLGLAEALAPRLTAVRD